MAWMQEVQGKGGYTDNPYYQEYIKRGKESIEHRIYHMLDECIGSRAWNVSIGQPEHTRMHCLTLHP